ncbi:cysteine--1-D-myo-inosityl 2-amino-2-deoxy-alpha-D-glucopyranoside ligase [Solicola gregarius]|uniref:L-cysteine:1D-myo-inositol 2-amino-2-deoxy-alpha-D-glucopyranoside ligase n=1 Tax=Solicola gregarius TaxID=2908642 RepID=A0AA46YKW4_9ACTN|nr:cysteine--1-D-myo-inosityl 2-amino-2-deoxy-alpha-D-glucopyranoside ligase [Solicola gregarius]UYM05024.1 cysteine--1-D-myo-inosityl 2-amino-2-deoxy-alpha-D-glucopyranoside ligase [Solicola gregarius]
MRAWPERDVPDLSALGFGRGPAPVVHDTASGGRLTIDPADRARMYVCGITPYDATHLGHAATYLGFDLLQRVWRDHGTRVTYVQNVTDVDDPLLERAAETGTTWEALAERETDLFRADMTALGVLPPDHYLGAVETIELVVDLVADLRKRDAVYDVDGDLYFAVHEDPAFGDISGLGRTDMTELFGERGGDPGRAGKRDPLDCLVWQAARPGEPAWDSELGRGRPGWHIECASMALQYLGVGFDVQGGGSDLVFPHHEMSASEAQVARDGERFARAYVHAGMVGYDGAKMSKSKGNLVLVSSLREQGTDPMVIRAALLGHHYRSDWEWTAADLTSAEQRVARWRTALATGGAGDVRRLVDDVRTALADDLDAPTALAAVDAWAAASPAGSPDADGDVSAVRAVLDSLLGLRV